MTNHRRKVGQKKPTKFENLRPLEQDLSKRKYKTMNGLQSWFAKHRFEEIQFPQALTQDCNYQYSRSIGGGRLHARVYVFPKRFVIESHFDRSDPKTAPIDHILEILSSDSDHHVIQIPR
ncbi:MAG: hypothetical protein DDT32_01440 [Syntrophomonadaceae bacterium]|nr:hypothetical protein [Bacillota bacterium]MBT9147675.1 hypothetical protein [Bacillota bacterium]